MDIIFLAQIYLILIFTSIVFTLLNKKMSRQYFMTTWEMTIQL